MDIQLQQQSTKSVILLHEIYGVNEHMAYYAQAMHAKGYDVYVPNLLQRATPFSYEEEQQAYNYFVDCIGFEDAKQQVLTCINRLAEKYSTIQLVGFSIGATIAWLCSDHPAIQKVICFYGSRIRQYTDLKPTAETLLIFGDKEASFNPYDLKEALAMHSNVQFHIVNAEHGFTDPFNPKYQKQLTGNS